MGKLQIKNFLLLSRRSYAVAAENLCKQPVLPVMSNAKDVMAAEDLSENKAKETFWMKDPKTGNWIPESHFGHIDVADLREKFLNKKETLKIFDDSA